MGRSTRQGSMAAFDFHLFCGQCRTENIAGFGGLHGFHQARVVLLLGVLAAEFEEVNLEIEYSNVRRKCPVSAELDKLTRKYRNKSV